MQLQSALGRLSPQQASELARTVELDRAMGRERLPSGPILDALRPLLRAAKPPRIPTLQRLICAGIEDFLSERVDEPRLDGLIPRASLGPWWQAMRFIAAKEIEALETRLREQLGAPRPALESLQHEAWEAAARWSAALGTELAKPKPPLTLRTLLARDIARDVAMIAQILTIARPLSNAMRSLQRVAARLNLLEERRVTDLSTDCVTLLKKEYLALSESHGMSARFLALAVLNRLSQPRQILRLGRALSWKANDSLVSNTEFFCVGARLIGEVERLARVLLTQMPRRGPLPDPTKLGMALVHYLDESEGVLSEIGVRRDSPWGAAILKTRSDVADALDEEFLGRFAELALAVLPLDNHRNPDFATEPSRETKARALQAAGFLKLLTQRGARHGFAKSAYETVDALGNAIEARIAALCEAVRPTWGNAAAIEAQARAAAEVCDELFEDGRSTAMMRRVMSALHAPAS